MIRTTILALLSLAASSCCFIFPGEGECDPREYVAQCRGNEAVNCTNVTPRGYGTVPIERYAAMPKPCGAYNVCIITEWNDAACVAPSVERCDDLDRPLVRRCVDGFEQRCMIREALRPPPRESGWYWVATRKACEGDETPRELPPTYRGPLLSKSVEVDLEGDGVPDRIDAKEGPSASGEYRWSVIFRPGTASERPVPVRAELWARSVALADRDSEGISDIIATVSEPRSDRFSESEIRYRFHGDKIIFNPESFEPISIRRRLEYHGDGPRQEFEWKVECGPEMCRELCADHEFSCIADRECVDGACEGLGF